MLHGTYHARVNIGSQRKWCKSSKVDGGLRIMNSPRHGSLQERQKHDICSNSFCWGCLRLCSIFPMEHPPCVFLLGGPLSKSKSSSVGTDMNTAVQLPGNAASGWVSHVFSTPYNSMFVYIYIERERELYVTCNESNRFAASPRFARGESRISFDMLKSLGRV